MQIWERDIIKWWWNIVKCLEKFPKKQTKFNNNSLLILKEVKLLRNLKHKGFKINAKLMEKFMNQNMKKIDESCLQKKFLSFMIIFFGTELQANFIFLI